MKILALLILALAASAEERVCLEAAVFGTSYHSNRSVSWNEQNWGGGLGVRYSDLDHLGVRCSVGSYRDSYNETAVYALFGPELVLGDVRGLHATTELDVGYLKGSGQNGPAVIPILGVGYDRVTVCVLAARAQGSPMEDATPQERASTNVIAAFLRVRLLDF